MAILINHNICDEAPECGGIEVCPVKAISYDYKKRMVVLDQSKCIECLKCTLPDVCPVGCFIYARNSAEEKKIKKMIKPDQKKINWLWQERYGCQPGRISPKAKILTDRNFKEFIEKKGLKVLDVWHNDYLDCRLHSPLFSDILKGMKLSMPIFKLDAQKYPNLAKKLKVKTFPSLLVYKDKEEVFRHEGYIPEKIITQISCTIKAL